ncbi:hypothetical protein A1O7_05185 [Cladophialophora yegresii CBS 114405]|uniref:Enoyl reductase (ER) domain-containing protein n=1 Tax=Cladophialophora yegresii CBS 114405 TaxID=1182544 RepID=W9VYW3_9EURO|nr:uncharacterized protein A1O7_05185 [Cladophialophora yegresii CBS 114405]EXJ61032.1 hypothetical protein A1O7_05185 [Cladophialophora yegresii CBS 114405]
MAELNKPYQLRQVQRPDALGPFDLLVKTVVASFCHTDLMVLEGLFPVNLPLTASHEGAGTVAAVGSAVTEFKLGDRVMSGQLCNPCGQCEDCLGPDDQKQYCTNTRGAIGVGVDGAFADYHVTDSRAACLLPDEISFADGASLACAGRTVYRAIKTSGVQPGRFLAIVGAGGGLGHLGIQFALAKGIEVIAIDARDGALELCREVGAKHVLDARAGQESVVAQVRKITGGHGADSTINLSGHSAALISACAVTRNHGTMVQVAGPDVTSISIFDLVFRDIRVKGSMLAGRDTTTEMLAEYAEHDMKVQTHVVYGLDQVPGMVEIFKSGAVKGKAICVVDRGVFDQDDAVRTR